jgi:hypothetical protein
LQIVLELGVKLGVRLGEVDVAHVQLIAKEVLAEEAGFGRGEETLGLGAEHGPIA